MAETSTIEWTDATWNPITGCTMVSAGCTNCYAMRLAGGRMKNHPSRVGLTRESGGRPVWTGKVRFNIRWIDEPLRWTRPRRIFVCAHGDLFHEEVPDEWIDRVFAVMALAHRHTFQVLTKRPERARAYLNTPGVIGRAVAQAIKMINEGQTKSSFMVAPDQLPNVWLGTSIEDQVTADARIPHLLATPAAVRFVSAEPLLGPVDLRTVDADDTGETDALAGLTFCEGRNEPADHAAIDWVIVGGESGPGARPMQEEWALALRDQCVAAGVAFHFKQWGEFAPSTEFRDGERLMVRRGKADAGRVLDGRKWDEMPAVSHG